MEKLRISSGDYSFIGRLEKELAPKTCSVVMQMLPLIHKAIHVRWSGEGFWMPFGDEHISLPYENHTSHPSKGEVLLYPGGISEMEIIFAYGSCTFASKVGQLAGNHFMTIENDLELLAEFGKRILWEGAQDVVVELPK